MPGFQSALERIIIPHLHQYTFMQDFLLSFLITVTIISSLNNQIKLLIPMTTPHKLTMFPSVRQLNLIIALKN